MKLNPPSLTDFYKKGHRDQYPEGTTLVYSNATCRGDRHFKGLPDFDHKVVNFGLQGICQWLLIDYWNENFFNKPKRQAVNRHARTVSKALGVEYKAEEFNALHDLGYLPIVIKALPEGARVNIKIPTYTICNTEPEFFWLTNYLETQIQAESWKCKVSATTAYEFRRLFERYAEMTGVDKSFVDFQGHDFSMRGMSGVFDATQCGAGHLLSFKGTDTIPSIEYLEDYYMGAGGYPLTEQDSVTMEQLNEFLGNLYKAGAKVVVDNDVIDAPKFYKIVKYDDPHNILGKYVYGLEEIKDPNILIGASVPATEHAVTCMSGQEGEINFFERLICKIYPNGFVSIVSDTWDFWQVITDYTVRLKDKIMARDGKVVFRPDSGDPVDIICGTAIDLTNSNKVNDLEEALNFARYNAHYEIIKYKDKYYEILSGAMASDWKLPGAFEVKQTPLDMGMPYREVQPTPEMKGAVECLWDVFGGTETDKGFKTLDSHVGLIYGDSINLERAQLILKRLADKGFSSANIVFGIGSFCVTSNTPILCSDLIWRKAGTLKVGQEIIAFDEDPTFSGGKGTTRRYRTAIIEANNPGVKDCIKITTDIGDPITASEDHPWLVWEKNRGRHNMFFNRVSKEEVPRNPGLVWKTTKELKEGDRIAFFGKPWKEEDSKDAGWLAGIYDGEGNISCATGRKDTTPSWKIGFSQNEGLVLDQVEEMLEDRGYTTYRGTRKCPHISLTGGWYNVLRFLGTIRPIRLLDKFEEKVLPSLPALSQNRTYRLATVTKTRKVGFKDIASIQTSTGTFITGGYLSHNTYQFVTRDTFSEAVKATFGIVNGEPREIFKDPKTGDGGKKSAKGLIRVEREGNDYMLFDQQTWEQEAQGELKELFRDGKMMRLDSHQAIRERLLNG